MTDPALIPFAGPVELVSLTDKLPALFLTEPRVSERFREFFAVNIRSRNTRRAYAQIAAHESSRTTGLYDCREDDVNLNEVERIGI